MACAFAFLLAGCQPAQQAAPADDKAASAADESRRVAEASLGKQAEVLVHGDLALNGLEQVLVVNRSSKNPPPAGGSADPSAIVVTRAAVLEREDGKWSQVLLCDEHLKNPSGYLGGSRLARASGWRLEYRQDPIQGLEMNFTPAQSFETSDANRQQSSGRNDGGFDVRWNKNAKRYQSFDQSHERYLSEVPSLETPQSILK